MSGLNLSKIPIAVQAHPLSPSLLGGGVGEGKQLLKRFLRYGFAPGGVR